MGKEYAVSEQEEELKTKIHNAFLILWQDTSSDRRQTAYVQLMTKVFEWCNSYLYRKTEYENGIEIQLADAMSEEIAESVEIIKNKLENAPDDVPKNRDDFLKYLE